MVMTAAFAAMTLAMTPGGVDDEPRGEPPMTAMTLLSPGMKKMTSSSNLQMTAISLLMTPALKAVRMHR